VEDEQGVELLVGQVLVSAVVDLPEGVDAPGMDRGERSANEKPSQSVVAGAETVDARPFGAHRRQSATVPETCGMSTGSSGHRLISSA
jgi:hypothetical protein